MWRFDAGRFVPDSMRMFFKYSKMSVGTSVLNESSFDPARIRDVIFSSGNDGDEDKRKIGFFNVPPTKMIIL